MSGEVIKLSEYKNARKVTFDPRGDIFFQLDLALCDAQFDNKVIELASEEGAHFAYVKPDSNLEQLDAIIRNRLRARNVMSKKALYASKSMRAAKPKLTLFGGEKPKNF